MHDDEQRDFADIREDLNSTSIDLLLTDARLALTFLSTAETTESRETAERNIRNARKAYEFVQKCRLRYLFTESEAAELNSTLVQVKRRLEALGESF
jgi:hypothetical protein